MRLVDALGGLSTADRETFARTFRVRIDRSKRLSPVEQLARALTVRPELHDYASWPEDEREAAAYLTEEPSGVFAPDPASGMGALIRRVVAFRMPNGVVLMPAEYRLQLPTLLVDDGKSFRTLLLSLDDESLHAITAQLLHRASLTPRWNVMAAVLDRLEAPGALDTLVLELSSKERDLLGHVVERGGEVDSLELLDLSRDPARYALAGHALVPKRGLSQGLVRRALLFRLAADRWIVPTEVAATVNRERRFRLEHLRRAVVEAVTVTDLAPMRAHISDDSSAIAFALLAFIYGRGVVVSPGGGFPRTFVKRAATHLHIDPVAGEFLLTLTRAAAVVERDATIGELGALLLRTWHASRAWDESRKEPDSFRVQSRANSAFTSTPALRDVLLEVLRMLPAGRFGLAADVVRVATSDLRAVAAQRSLARASGRERSGLVADVDTIFARFLRDSLPALGLIDFGRSDEGDVVRLGARGRVLVDALGARADASATQQVAHEPIGRWTGEGRLRLSPNARVRDALALAPIADVFAADGEVFFQLSATTAREAASRGVDVVDLLDTLQTRLPFDAFIEELKASAERWKTPCTWVPAAAFIEIPDDDVRSALLRDDEASSVFIMASPPGGLLVRPGVSKVNLRAILRRGGVLLRTSSSDSEPFAEKS